MPARKALDRRPGTMPEIRTDGDSVTFRLEIAEVANGTRLIIRCDADGSVWMAIER
jgi:hypothetical protein